MPKMKTKKSVAKRFRVKKSGKVKFKPAQLRHILTSKDKKNKRQKRAGRYVSGSDLERFAKLLPYG